MTVDELIDRLKTVSEFGHGKEQVKAWDADSENWEPVSVVQYGHKQPVLLYTDEE